MIVGVSLVKDEADILPSMIRHMLSEGVHHLIVADNNSTDGTTDHLHDFIRNGAPLTYVHDPDPAYRQADKMNRLVHRAGRMGATWIVPWDADEWWFSPHGRLAEVLTPDIEPVQWVEGYYHVPHPDDPDDPDPTKRMTHRRQGRDCPQSKVCFRYHPKASIHPGNHNVERPGSRGLGRVAFREFQYRSYEHFVRKVRNGKAAYDAAPDLHPELGIHWRRLGALSDEELEAEWQSYLATPTVYDPIGETCVSR